MLAGKQHNLALVSLYTLKPEFIFSYDLIDDIGFFAIRRQTPQDQCIMLELSYMNKS